MFVAAFLIGSLAAGLTDTSLTDLEILHRAAREFQEGVQARAHPAEARSHFQAALTHYEMLRLRSAHNPDLYRNQANAAWMAGELPQAILALRRGLTLAPSDPALRQALEELRDQVPYPADVNFRPPADAWPLWLPRLSAQVLCGVAFGFYVLCCFAFTRWRMLRGRGSFLLLLTALPLACVSGYPCLAEQWQRDQDRQHPLVVVNETAALRTGNGNSYPVHKGLPSARRGMEGRLRFIRGDWLQVEFPGGAVGWLRREQVLLGRVPLQFLPPPQTS